MEFLIDRASIPDWENYTDEEYIKKLKLPKWIEIIGVTTTGNVYKDKKCRIKINSLEELLKLNKDIGDLIINGNELLIYDDYIE